MPAKKKTLTPPASAPEPNNRAVTAGMVRVRAVVALAERGLGRIEPGQAFETSAARVAALGDAVQPA